MHGGHHNHGHSHASHDHSHVEPLSRESGQRALWRALAVTLCFLFIEAAGGWLSGSLALLADAGHMLTDASSLGLALAAGWVSRRSATRRRSYGWHRVEILAAFLNGLALIIVSVFIGMEAIERVVRPTPVHAPLLLAVAAAGFAANLVSAAMLYRAGRESLNVRGAFLHVVSDMLGSVGALTAGILILAFGWVIADPIIGIIISLLVLISSWTLIRESISILLESTPRHVDTESILEKVLQTPGVVSAHDLHIWTVTSGYLVLTLHIVAAEDADSDKVLAALSEFFERDWGITHTTIQVEKALREKCANYH
jgi:cobalt-zinc-cadmium efflux system protein